MPIIIMNIADPFRWTYIIYTQAVNWSQLMTIYATRLTRLLLYVHVLYLDRTHITTVGANCDKTIYIYIQYQIS